jgi:hypothetical protein
MSDPIWQKKTIDNLIVALAILLMLVFIVNYRSGTGLRKGQDNPPVQELKPIGPSRPVGVPLPSDTAPSVPVRARRNPSVVAPPLPQPAVATEPETRLSVISRESWCLEIAGWKALCTVRETRK